MLVSTLLRGKARAPVVFGAGAVMAGTLTLTLPASAHQATVTAPANPFAGHRGYAAALLVSDIPGLAQLTDPNVVNPWGIAFGPTTPLWSSNNGAGTNTLYAGANGVNAVNQVPLVVKTPNGPTGVAFNDTSGFNVNGQGPAKFVFVNLAGQIMAWTFTPPAAPPTAATLMRSVKGGIFTGVAVAQTDRGPRLYVADAANDIVRVYNGRFQQIGATTDRSLPAPLTPYNVAVLNNRLFVTYALPPGVDRPGAKGAIDVFSLRGRLLRRLAVGGPLNGPWGMAIAPAQWGIFSGDLIVGNEDGGDLNAFDLTTGHFMGDLRTPEGLPIRYDGMWGLKFGNGTIGTTSSLIFAAGIDDYGHGIIGAITPVRGSD
jgi:uncharacterized protein (TIGR03118 family)